MKDLTTTAKPLEDDCWTYLDWCEHAILENLRAEAECAKNRHEDEYEEEFSVQDLLEFEFEDFLKEFDDILGTISREQCYHVEGRNLGWRHLSGNVTTTASCASEFIRKVFPKTDHWSLHGKYDEPSNTLEFTLSHHDAPTGEFYTVIEGIKKG